MSQKNASPWKLLTRTLCFILFISQLTISCGTEAPAATWRCPGPSGGFATCDTGMDYCLATYAGDVILSLECIPLPMGCASCDCASDDSPSQANICPSLLTCEQSNQEITVACSSGGGNVDAGS